jgi:MinD-like ATPase involved in chromosome partitioning or flagellar assembly
MNTETSQYKAPGKIVTFYSYKGGVGRSMAMANIAVLLAEWGYKTLIIDWDLEAPGLENFYKSYLNIDTIAQKKGLIDLLGLNASSENIEVSSIQWDDYISTIQINKTQIDFLSAGKRDDNYINNVRRFDYAAFYEEYDGGQFIEDIRDAWKDKYDFVLIDSRTGLTDSSGVCTIQMPDILILLFTPNVQSFNGIKSVARRSMEGQKKLIYDRFRLRTLPVPSRIENAETTLQDHWINKIAQESVDMFDWLPIEVKEDTTKELVITPLQVINYVKIPYRTFYAYDEMLAVVDRPRNDPQDIWAVYETIAATIANDFESLHLLIDSRDLFIKKAKGIAIVDPVEAEKLRNELKKKEEIESISKEKVSRLEEDLATTQQTIEIKSLESKKLKRKYSVYSFIFVVLSGFGIGYFATKYFDESKRKENELSRYKAFALKTDSSLLSNTLSVDTLLSMYTDYYLLSGEYKDSAANYKVKLDSLITLTLKSRMFNLYYSLDPAEKTKSSVDRSLFLADTLKQYGDEMNIAAPDIYKKWDSIHYNTTLILNKNITDRYKYVDIVNLNSSPAGFTVILRENIFSIVQKKPAKLELQLDKTLRINSIKAVNDVAKSMSDSYELLNANSRILESQVKNNKGGDIRVQPDLEKIAKVLNNETTGIDSFWIYLGEKDNKGWIQRNFDVKVLPNTNEIIRANTAVYKRTAVPVYQNNVWQFGKITGVVESGSLVRVIKLAGVANGFIWAMVMPENKKRLK